jgi:type VII secretion integral membrane protein EccD
MSGTLAGQPTPAPHAPPAGAAPWAAQNGAPAATPTAPRTPQEFVRIGVAGPAGRADLAVPAAVPLARLMLTLLRHAGEEPGPDGGAGHGGWVLRRADGTRLDPATSLAAQHIHEGDLLFLGHGTDDATPPVYDDVVEVIGEHGVRGGWPAQATRRASGALAAIAVLAVCGALAAAPGRLPGWLGLSVALFALGVAALMSRAFGDTGAGTFAAVLAAPAAMVGACRLLGTEPGLVDGFTAAHLVLACAVLACVGALGPALVGGGDGTFTALVVSGLLGGTGALACAIWDSATPAEGATIAAPLALVLTTVWPTLALRVARMPAPRVAASAEDLEELPSQLEHDRLRGRVLAARRVLTGMLVGSHLVVAAGTLVLFAATELWSSVLGGVLVLLTLLRCRLFKEASQTAVPLITALVTAAGAAAFTIVDRVDTTVPLLGVLMPAGLLIALICGASGILAGRQRINPRLSRTLDLFETALLLSVVPLVLAVWQVYPALLDLKV